MSKIEKHLDALIQTGSIKQKSKMKQKAVAAPEFVQSEQELNQHSSQISQVVKDTLAKMKS